MDPDQGSRRAPGEDRGGMDGHERRRLSGRSYAGLQSAGEPRRASHHRHGLQSPGATLGLRGRYQRGRGEDLQPRISYRLVLSREADSRLYEQLRAGARSGRGLSGPGLLEAYGGSRHPDLAQPAASGTEAAERLYIPSVEKVMSLLAEVLQRIPEAGEG